MARLLIPGVFVTACLLVAQYPPGQYPPGGVEDEQRNNPSIGVRYGFHIEVGR